MTPAASSSRSRCAAAVILTLLLLLLAFRLTATESLRDTLAQKIATVAPAAAPKTADASLPQAVAGQAAATPAAAPKSAEAPVFVPFIGPTFTAAYAALAFLLAAGASFLAARVGALTFRRLGQLALIGLILALTLVSTWHAANRFNALIGTVDLAASLAAAWTITLLCDDRLLGARGRQAVIAAIIAICALGCGKALLQRFVEFPDTLQWVKEHPDEALRNNGINPDDPVQKSQFMYRLNSAEVSGFGALSNVFATQMIAGIAVLTGLLAAGVLLLKAPAMPAATPRARRAAETPSNEIPVYVVALVAVGVLLAVSCAALAMTASKGGAAAAILAALAIAPGIYFREALAARRKLLLALAAAAAIVLPAAVLGWGLTHHGLPSRSLLFRWHYWTASVPMIESHPVWGVGFNNFGDYYLRYKLPSSPEDVKDPHSFFIRLAAEAGLPATLALTALLLWMLSGALVRSTGFSLSGEDRLKPVLRTQTAIPGLGPSLLLAAFGAIVWVPLHFLAEAPNEYTIILTLLFAAVAWFVFAAVLALFDALQPAATGTLVLAAVVGALAMLLYDQVNMALVTGPVAMLFWIMLALGESTAGVPSAQSKIKNQKSRIAALVPIPLTLLALSLITALAFFLPLAHDAFLWDPAPYEYAYIRQITGRGVGDAASALESLNAAIDRAPNSIELRLQRITLLREGLHRPVADQIRQVLDLDTANAGIRLMLALPDTDLPPAERIAALQQALELDRQLSPDEAKRMTAAQLQQIEATIARLKQAP